MRKFLRNKSVALLFFIFSGGYYSAQSPCDSITPVFNVDLTGQPNGTWFSTAIARNGNCCGTLDPDKCIEFVITIDEKALGINFQIASGAVPPGALFYQIGCGPQVPVGSVICLDGPGPHLLTFCKPGNNINSYSITSVAAPEVSPDDTIGSGCSTSMHASGLLQDSTITWTSVFPGNPGDYNSYLNCTTGCDNVFVNSQSDAPAYIDFTVCGKPLAGPCVSNSFYWCDTIRIYFTPPVACEIESVPPIICAENNEGIVLSGNYTGGLPPYSFQWLDGNGNILSTDAVLQALSSGTYFFNVLDKNYSECPSPGDSVSFIITEKPHADFSATEVCFGEQTLFHNLSTSSVANIVSAAWDFGNFSQVNYSGSPDYIYAAHGTFNVTLTVTADNGCTSSVIKPVVVHPLPQANFTSTPVCEGLPVQFSNNAILMNGEEPSSFLWAFGDGSPVSTSEDPTHQYFSSGIYNVSFVVFSAEGCSDTVTKPVIVHPAPTVKFYLSDSVSCSANCLQFSDSSTGEGIIDWSWDFGDGSLTDHEQHPQHCYQQSGNYEVTLTVTSVNGCSFSTTQNKNITIKKSPVAEFTFSPNETTTLNPMIQFQDLSEGALKWQWNFGDNYHATPSFEQNPQHLYSDSGKYCITLTVENVEECTDTVTHCVIIKPEFTFFIPNAFTPGGNDLKNDEFAGVGTNIIQYEMWIYDRWGDMIFYTDQLDKRWNGCVQGSSDLVQEDVYLYLVKLIDVNGFEHHYEGKVTVIR